MILTQLPAALKLPLSTAGVGLHGNTLEVSADLDSVLAHFEAKSLAEGRFATEPQVREDRQAVLQIQQRHGQKRLLQPGEAAAREGEVADRIMKLTRGRLDMTVGQASGHSTTLNRLLPGELIGDVGCYAEALRNTSVAAAMGSELRVVTTEKIKAMEERAPADAAPLHRAMARVVADRLTSTTQLLKDAEV